jgi:hypothetical protein
MDLIFRIDSNLFRGLRQKENGQSPGLPDVSKAWTALNKDSLGYYKGKKMMQIRGIEKESAVERA